MIIVALIPLALRGGKSIRQGAADHCCATTVI